MIRPPTREAAFRVPKVRPKRKGGIPLDELLAAHAGDDARLEGLLARYGRAIVPASTIARRRSTAPKRPNMGSQKAPEARFARSNDSHVVQIAPPRLVGYVRVSTDEQTARLQRDALRAAGVDGVFEDKESGAQRSRPELERALAALRPGDTLVIWKLDRLGRSLWDLLDVAEALRERSVALRSLTEHIDTATAAGKMLYAVLGAVAQFERDVLRERTVAGMRRQKPRRAHWPSAGAQTLTGADGPDDARSRRKPVARRPGLARGAVDALPRDRPNMTS